MTFEARLIIVLLYFALWGFLGLLPWTFAAVARRGREVLPALPIAVAAAWLAGVLVPIVGERDATGFLVSTATAFAAGVAGTAAGVALSVRLTAGDGSVERAEGGDEA
ncbi:MAG: hypothetical protein Q7R32_02080 [Dehalococcoidia bacterium]|nr:hypothetical protein [Dehalococcoidia bacterium]